MLPDPVTHWPLYAGVVALVLLLALAQRSRALRTVLQLAIWTGGLLLVFALVAERGRFDPSLGRFARLLSPDSEQVSGRETRVRQARDGHFWVRVRIGGVTRRMLVDSGATVTALSTATAAAAGLKVSDPTFPVVLQTANGAVRAQTATVAELRLGNIVARDVAVVVSPAFGDMDVIGMNVLSRLKGWRVEEGTLVLTPHHPQGD